MLTKIVRTEPTLDTPSLITTTDSPCPEKLLRTTRVMKLKMPTKIAIKVIEPPSEVETARSAERMTKSSKNDTTRKRQTKQNKIFDLTGLTFTKINWEPFYCSLSQEEFKVVIVKLKV
jgi:hypothetical protein